LTKPLKCDIIIVPKGKGNEKMENNLNVMGIVRAMDDLRRVVIPKEIRKAIGVYEGDSLDILAMTNGSILLRKVVNNQPVCDCPCAVTPVEKEKKVVHFNDAYDKTRIIKITDEQNKLLDWLVDNDYLSDEIDINEGYPEVEDLT
jgi:AbrB family looped-hinge helix DNA binding protein